MTIWTSFFLVVCTVILAYPFLAPGNGSYRGGSAASEDLPPGDAVQELGHWHEEEVQLDRAAGRLGPDEPGTSPHEVMGKRAGDEAATGEPAEVIAGSEEEDGSLPEGPEAQ